MSTLYDPIDYERRFGGIARLYGQEALQRFAAAHVAVVGVGGVGSWAVEALARSAVGTLTLIDLDHVAPSNVNRQLHALDGTFGKAKVTAMAERIRAINPNCTIREIDDFATPENLDELLAGADAVVDAIDQVRAKAALIAWGRKHKVPVVVCGGAGGKADPTRIRVADLTETIQDPLLSKVRNVLRRDHGFPKGGDRKFGVEAVFSTEPLTRPASGAACDTADGPHVPMGLNCAGYGSAMVVTASVGLIAVARVLDRLARK